MQFNYAISRVPGKMLYTTDIPLCAPVDSVDQTASIDVKTEMFVQAIVSCFPVSTSCLGGILKA